MKSITLPSPAKINLSLRILGKREDGFHEISTLMCKLALADTVTVKSTSGKNSVLTCTAPEVPTDESNLALRALRLFERETGRPMPCTIHLEKKIPSGAGLGGGSSNAAVTLAALNELAGHPLPQETLLKLAAEIGSDIPFFLLKENAAIGTGRGENVSPVSFPWRLPIVLIKPPFPIPTPWAYQRWSSSSEIRGAFYAPQLCVWGEMVNDLERPVFEKYALLPALKSKLLEQPDVIAALMSGSGSTLFAVTRTAAACESLAQMAAGWCGSESFITVTHTAA
jgi:4-diphosphocytidyl-2-C-methyl-D-erythritol kinase